MRRQRLHTASIIMGSILALAIAFSQYLTLASFSSVEKVKSEQTNTSDEQDKGSCISLPSFSIPAPVSVQVNLDAYCLFEIFFEQNIDEPFVDDDISYAGRLFETMFQVIISPNAP